MASSPERDDRDERYIVKCRGLPWSATVGEIVDFFGCCNVLDGEDGVHVHLDNRGRPSGMAFVEFESEDDIPKALDMHKKYLGRRFVEVYKTSSDDMERTLKIEKKEKSSSSKFDPQVGDFIVRMRGLPFESDEGDILKFYDGLDVAEDGILFTKDKKGRPSGEAFVQFMSRSDVHLALEKNKELIGSRYIEIFPSSIADANEKSDRFSRRPGERDREREQERDRSRSRRRPYDRDRDRDFSGSRNGRSSSGRGDRSVLAPWAMNDNRYENNYGGDNDIGGRFDDIRSRFNDIGGRMNNGGGANNRDQLLGLFDDLQSRFNELRGRIDDYNGQGGGQQQQPVSGRPVIRMRGLPFRATIDDIYDFFRPVADPVDVSIIFNRDGRPSGDADVTFASDNDATRAMSKNRDSMQHRYIELYFDKPGQSRRERY